MMTSSRRRQVGWTGAAVALVLGGFCGWQWLATASKPAQAWEPIPAALRGQLAVASDLSEAFQYVSETIQPSVVRISSVTRAKPQVRRRATGPQLPPGFPEEFRRFFEDDFGGGFGGGFGTPMPREQQGLGSGVIVTSDGYILTNNHVVREADEVTVALADRREFRAKIVGGDAKTDLAVLKIEAKNLPAAKLGDSDRMKVGQWVLAVGCPFGLEQTVTAGIISARGRQVGIIERGYEDFLQTDAAINPGNSGGPLVNLQGEVIAINTAIESRNGGNMGIGFAIPTNLARSVMDSLIKDGKVRRGWLGAAIQELDEGLAKNFGFGDKKGVLIGSVLEKSPAAKAKLREGDIVIELNGKPVETVSQLQFGIAAISPGGKADLLVFRDGKQQTVTVEVGELPADGQETPKVSGEESESGELGVAVQPLTRELAEQIGHPAGELAGVVVTQVTPGSLAERGGIRAGDVLVMLGRKKITNLDDYREAIQGLDVRQGVVMQFAREGVKRFAFLRASE